jgi:dihydroorotate dehydrogenase
MGFNNNGVEAMKARLQHRPNNLVIGANLGKNKNTPEDQAVNDYVLGFRSLYAHADYFVVNVSSPNTPGLRALQDREPLSRILNTLVEERSRQAVSKPILLKIAPDLSHEQVLDIASIVKETGIDGVIATNTTISRDGLQTPVNEIERAGAGGLSGWPVRARSTEIVRMLRKNLGEAYLIIGCGGIERAEDALEKLEAGADLIQIYTGFIYEGPALIRSILKKLH